MFSAPISAPGATVLEVIGLCTGYGRSQTLFEINFEVRTGEVVTLMGRNGMGKTTTIKALFGLLPAWSGKVRFDGRDITGLPSYRVARLGLGLVPEGRQVFPNLTVEENLMTTAANYTSNPNPWTRDRIFEMFPPLLERRNNMGNQLSGGEQQMLAIGRALMTNPRLLVLDEATEGLAPLLRLQIWEALSSLKREGQAILVVDKDIEALIRLADHHFMLEKGRVVWQGNNASLQEHSDLRKRYLSV
jgi:branched-chain amino acid transport system ATP-binding protein